MIDALKENWRVVVAALLVAVSIGFVFGVVGIGPTAPQEGSGDMTTLQFGLQLDGGTRFTVPLHGVTAEDVEIEGEYNEPQVEREIAESIGVAPTQVDIRVTQPDQPVTQEDQQQQQQQQSGELKTYIEVTSENVTQDELRQVLDERDIGYENVRSGVTTETRQQTVTVINNKINEAGLSGGTARVVTSATGQNFISIEVPGQDRSDIRDLLNDRGSVRVDIYYPTENESGEQVYRTREAVLESDDFQGVGNAQRNPQLGEHVPVTLTDSAAREFRQDVMETGMAPSGSTCFYEQSPEDTGPCLLTKVDGEVVYSAGMSPSLARDIADGNWVESPQFVLQTDSMDQAQELSLHLTAGALPTGLDFESGTSVYVSPTQGERFKTAGLLIGLAALIGVSLKVFVRYRDLRVAAPMVAMSLSEVLVLLGFAALVGYPVDLAVIAGFVAVIGTGVDDLIIIANEVLQEGDVSSKKVFENRYSKAFWIIMAAAITTTVALSPLIVLSLGKLAGFAIFTIFGIAVGVLITRPAYADILKYLLTNK